jgi:hypothetical protein
MKTSGMILLLAFALGNSSVGHAFDFDSMVQFCPS